MFSIEQVRWRRLLLAPLIALLLMPVAGGPPVEGEFDILLLGGRILDGTGNPWFSADIGIRGGRITAIGRLQHRPATRIIDVRGLIVAPGFIDLHTHAFDGLHATGRSLSEEEKARRAAPNLVSQGVTTLVTNQDGRGGWPIVEQARLLEHGGIGPNTILLVGHGVVRRLVMGSDFRRKSDRAEVARMRRLIRQGMEEGAFGVSAGLEYVPGRWSDTEEMVSIVEEVAASGGVFFEHERASGADPMWYLPSQDSPVQPTVLDSVRESIEIARRTGARVICTHLKSRGVRSWGLAEEIVALIRSARNEGIDIWGDCYPYNTTGSDGNTLLIPGWVSGGDYQTALRGLLQIPEKEAALRADISHEISRRGGASNLLIVEFPNPSLVGKTLAEVAHARGKPEVDMAIEIALSGFPHMPGGARIRGFSLSRDDVDVFARQPWVATASDAGIALPGDGFVHPRFYGTFPRKICKYARDGKTMTVADAIRSMTSLPAQILQLRDRGLIREDYAADLVVFDLDTLGDAASVFDPHQYATGIRYVLINGEFVVDDSELTWTLPGKVLSAKRQ